MKTIFRFLSLVLVCVCACAFFSCDVFEFTGPRGEKGEQGDKGDQGEPGKQGPPGTPGAPVEEPPEEPLEYLSFTGERYEKYYLAPDPSVEQKLSPSFRGPPVKGGTSGGVSEFFEGSGYNQLTIHDFPLKNLIEKTSTQVRVTGTVAALGYHYTETAHGDTNSHYLYGNIPFDSTIAVTPNEFSVQDYNYYNQFSLSLDDFELPATGDYAKPLAMNHNVVFSVSVPSGTLESLSSNILPLGYVCPFQGLQSSFQRHYCSEQMNIPVEEKFAQDITIDIPVNTRHVATSRDFYQYISFTVTYPPDVALYEITASQIVASHTYDPDTNSVTVLFKEYDSPYTGEVLSFVLVHENGKTDNKVISIN